MSEALPLDAQWLAQLAARAERWAQAEDDRWGKPERDDFASSLRWGSAWAATRFARLACARHSSTLVDALPSRVRAARGAGEPSSEPPAVPRRISLSRPEPATLLRAFATLLAHGGSELAIAPSAARMWRHFEPSLGPRLEARGVSLRVTDDELDLASGRSSGAAVSLDAIPGSSAPGCEVFASHAIDVVIAPYLHDRRDLGRLADHLVSELAAPAPGVSGLRLLVARTWLQRAVLREQVEARLARLCDAREVTEGGASRLRWIDRTEDAMAADAISERALDASNTAELFDAARACAADGSSSPVAASAYVAPFALEPEAASKSFERWRAAHPARVVVSNQRASHAFALGCVAWSDGEHLLPALDTALAVREAAGGLARSFVDAPFLSPLEGRRMLEARLRFERSITSFAAVRLRAFDGLARF